MSHSRSTTDVGFDQLLLDVRDWHQRVFGRPVHAPRTAQKLLEEAAEAFAEARAGHRRTLRHELIDVLLVTCSMLATYIDDDSDPDVLTSMRNKMWAVERRDQVTRDRDRLPA